GGFHLLQHVGMATDGPLTEDHHAAGEDVGAFHGDGDRHRLIAAAEIVLRPHADTLAAVHVHGVVHALAHTLGQVVLDHAGQHCRLLAEIHRAGSHGPCGIHHVGITADP